MKGAGVSMVGTRDEVNRVKGWEEEGCSAQLSVYMQDTGIIP